MSAAPVVRRAVQGDARALAELHVRAWQWAYRGQLPDSFLESLDATIDRRETWRNDTLARDGGEERTWVAAAADQIIGFADTGPTSDIAEDAHTAELFTIYLDEQFVGIGVGRMLLRHAMQDLQNRGYRQAVLWVLASNARARRFYEAAGWQADAGEKTQEQRGITLREVRYRRQLSS